MSITFINGSGWSMQQSSSKKFVYYGLDQHCPLISVKEACRSQVWEQRQGAFSYVIADTLEHEFALIRDSMGCAPLYYYYDGRYLITGSNLPDIIQHLPHSPVLDTTQLLALLTWTQQYTDNTFYQRIKRLEPGCIAYISPQKPVVKIPYWTLNPHAKDLIYPQESDYLEAFQELIHESIRFNTSDATSLGGELSGGLDSSAILLTAHQQKIHYPLFMHIANPGSKEIDDKHLAEALLEHIHHQDVMFINADTFDLIQSLQFCAKQFAGVAPYIFFMLAQNIHQAVSQRGCTVLLSGAGGDQCVSSHASVHDSLHGMIHTGSYRLAWSELLMEYQHKGKVAPALLRRAEILLKYSHPQAYHLLGTIRSIGQSLRDFFQSSDDYSTPFFKPKPFYRSLREAEWDVLQGPHSHELRMRVEYSAVLASAMGFEYRYPLLYPKLVKFCFHLPMSYKRRNGIGRYLIRKYLETLGPQSVYTKLQKKGGIIPATLDQSHRYLTEGKFDDYFHTLPYINLAIRDTPHRNLTANMLTYMIKFFNQQTIYPQPSDA